MRSLVLLLPLLLIVGSAHSAQVSLQPSSSSVDLRSYGFGLIPLDGHFTRFHGWMEYDPSHPDACEVMLTIEAESLIMPSAMIRERILGPGTMDAARYPELVFRGSCAGAAVTGDLTMHGQTHPVSLEFTREKGAIVATGRVHRAEWGMTGSPLLGGPIIRIRVRLPDPLGGQQT